MAIWSDTYIMYLLIMQLTREIRHSLYQTLQFIITGPDICTVLDTSWPSGQTGINWYGYNELDKSL
jgi:hypothetical protein